jgi:predicted nucleic acid-binding protein
MVESANLGLVDRLDCKSFTCGELDTFTYSSVVTSSNNLRADLIVLEDIRVLAGDEEIAVMAGSVEGLNSP